MKILRHFKDPFTRILFGVFLGICCGVFFGEWAANLKAVGDIYVRLLQMVVLPYVLATLIGGIGRLDPAGAGRIGIHALALIVFMWLVSWLIVLTIPLSYPAWESGSFFSSSLVADPVKFDPVKMFIPSNIFAALTDALVPAIVVFSLAMGLALMAMANKDGVLAGLAILEDAFGRIASFVVKLAPLGIFAIAANAAGTLRVEELAKLQIYLSTYVAAWALLAFLTLPLLVAVATPLSYRQVLRHARTAMLTAFAANTVLVVLPLIAEESKKLLEQSGMLNEEGDSIVDVLVPTAYTLPSAGTPISLAFILFAAWFAGSPLSLDQYPNFAFLGALSSFGGMFLSLPYLLDFFKLPADLFQLFVVGTVATSQLWSALAAMHGIVICLLGACAVAGKLRWMSLAIVTAVSVVISAAVFWTLSFAFQDVLPEQGQGERQLLSKRITNPLENVRFVENPEPLSDRDQQRSRLDVIRERGSLRVGFNQDRMPFAYENDQGDMVGLDIELMQALARDLDVGLELVRLNWEGIVDMLDAGRIDIVIGGIPITTEKVTLVAFSQAYLDETPGFLVRDHNRRRFSDIRSVRRMTSLKIAVRPRYFSREIPQLFPNAAFVLEESVRPFLRGEMEDVDAFLFSAEMGSAWTLMYPSFAVVVPSGMNVKVPIGFALSFNNDKFRSFLNSWLGVKIKVGDIARKHNQWILGQDPAGRKPRWSVIRNVLHWVD